jgi:hypothetical protein
MVSIESGWFSCRSACYLAAGRPVIEQDTGSGDIMPVGPGIHAFRTIEEAIDVIEADYYWASTYAAAEVTREHFDADCVLA